MARLAEVLETAGHATFLPQRDGLELALLGLTARLGPLAATTATLAPSVERLLRRAVFSLDVYEIVEDCQALICNLNGRVPDEGAAVEAGIAFARGLPVILYKQDARSTFFGQDNPMLTGLTASFSNVTRLEALPHAVATALANRPREPLSGPTAPLSPALARTVAFGRQVARLLQRLPVMPPDVETTALIEALTALDPSPV
jgi:nucleoside 2-deoxyribosyltransferase